jgi:hypothetical protein
MKYLLKLQLARQGAVCTEYYTGDVTNPSPLPLTNLYPELTLESQLKAKRFNTPEEARVGLDEAIELTLAQPRYSDPLFRRRYAVREEQRIRSSAIVEKVPDLFVIRAPVVRNAVNSFEYYQPKVDHVIKFVSDTNEAKYFVTEQAARDAFSEMTDYYRKEYWGGERSADEIEERVAELLRIVEVIPV